jgi:2-methylcitrate dehydratase PrpD
MSEITRELAKFATETQQGDPPNSVVKVTKRLLMEHLGVALGALSTDKTKMMAALGRRNGRPADASVIGKRGQGVMQHVCPGQRRPAYIGKQEICQWK